MEKDRGSDENLEQFGIPKANCLYRVDLTNPFHVLAVKEREEGVQESLSFEEILSQPEPTFEECFDAVKLHLSQFGVDERVKRFQGVGAMIRNKKLWEDFGSTDFLVYLKKGECVRSYVCAVLLWTLIKLERFLAKFKLSGLEVYKPEDYTGIVFTFMRMAENNFLRKLDEKEVPREFFADLYHADPVNVEVSTLMELCVKYWRDKLDALTRHYYQDYLLEMLMVVKRKKSIVDYLANLPQEKGELFIEMAKYYYLLDDAECEWQEIFSEEPVSGQQSKTQQDVKTVVEERKENVAVDIMYLDWIFQIKGVLANLEGQFEQQDIADVADYIFSQIFIFELAVANPQEVVNDRWHPFFRYMKKNIQALVRKVEQRQINIQELNDYVRSHFDVELAMKYNFPCEYAPDGQLASLDVICASMAIFKKRKIIAQFGLNKYVEDSLGDDFLQHLINLEESGLLPAYQKLISGLEAEDGDLIAKLLLHPKNKLVLERVSVDLEKFCALMIANKISQQKFLKRGLLKESALLSRLIVDEGLLKILTLIEGIENEAQIWELVESVVKAQRKNVQKIWQFLELVDFNQAFVKGLIKFLHHDKIDSVLFLADVEADDVAQWPAAYELVSGVGAQNLIDFRFRYSQELNQQIEKQGISESKLSFADVVKLTELKSAILKEHNFLKSLGKLRLNGQSRVVLEAVHSFERIGESVSFLDDLGDLGQEELGAVVLLLAGLEPSLLELFVYDEGHKVLAEIIADGVAAADLVNVFAGANDKQLLLTELRAFAKSDAEKLLVENEQLFEMILGDFFEAARPFLMKNNELMRQIIIVCEDFRLRNDTIDYIQSYLVSECGLALAKGLTLLQLGYQQSQVNELYFQDFEFDDQEYPLLLDQVEAVENELAAQIEEKGKAQEAPMPMGLGDLKEVSKEGTDVLKGKKITVLIGDLPGVVEERYRSVLQRCGAEVENIRFGKVKKRCEPAVAESWAKADLVVLVSYGFDHGVYYLLKKYIDKDRTHLLISRKGFPRLVGEIAAVSGHLAKIWRGK